MKHEPTRTFRFGAFELDLGNRDLRAEGVRMKLQHKPFEILACLLEKPGELVTRQQLAQRLWPSLHVRFDRSLNTAVNTLRQTLGDSPRKPRYIETRPGIGYCFIAPVERSDEPQEAATPHDSEARHDYLKGRYFCSKMTEDDLYKGIAHFEAALAQDSAFAPAYAGLADAYRQSAHLCLIPAKEAYLNMQDCAMAALRIDNRLADGYAALAAVKKFRDRDWGGADAEYRKALALKDGYSDGHRHYGAHLSAMGRSQDGLTEIRRALELDPLSLPVHTELAWGLYMARDFQGSVEQSWKILAMEPKFAPAQHTLGLAYEQLGMHEEALVELQNGCAGTDNHPEMLAALGHAYTSAGQEQQALDCLRKLEEVALRRPVSPYWLSILYTGTGSLDRSLAALEKAREERDVWLVWLNVEPRFDALRSDPRFNRILASIGLTIS